MQHLAGTDLPWTLQTSFIPSIAPKNCSGQTLNSDKGKALKCTAADTMYLAAQPPAPSGWTMLEEEIGHRSLQSIVNLWHTITERQGQALGCTPVLVMQLHSRHKQETKQCVYKG